jgi:hypothetical protein
VNDALVGLTDTSRAGIARFTSIRYTLGDPRLFLMKPSQASHRTLPWPSILIVFTAIIAWAALLWGAEFTPRFTVLENFERYAEGEFPTSWRVGQSEARTIYRVQSEFDNHFLRAHAEKRAVHIGLGHVFNPKSQQRLSWRWRVHALPQGADERDSEKHDAAAQVYVIFDNQFWPRVIKYVWSSVGQPGARFINPLYQRGRIVILRSGRQERPSWREESVNFYDDYKQFFGSEPGSVQGIGVLSSSDATKSLAIAVYDDFLLLP